MLAFLIGCEWFDGGLRSMLLKRGVRAPSREDLADLILSMTIRTAS
jgi:hypothetical protein